MATWREALIIYSSVAFLIEHRNLFQAVSVTQRNVFFLGNPPGKCLTSCCCPSRWLCCTLIGWAPCASPAGGRGLSGASY